MALDPDRILFFHNFFDDDESTVAVADANVFFGSFLEDTVGAPQAPEEIIPTTGADPIPPPPCPELTLYDFLPEILRLNDPDEALKAVVDAWDNEYCLYRDDIFKLTQLIDPFQAPTEVLPHLAATFDITDFDVLTNEMLLRHQIATAVETYKLKGTIDGVQLALLFMGWLSEVIELYEFFEPNPAIDPAFPSMGGAHQRKGGQNRLRRDSDIIILVKPLVNGLVFDSAAQAAILDRLDKTLPIHVTVIEVGRFECPLDQSTVSDTLLLNLLADASEFISAGSVEDIFILEIIFPLVDASEGSDTLDIYDSDTNNFGWDASGTGWDTSGVGWDGGKNLLASV